MNELPIVRIVRWFEHRRSLCRMCRDAPRVDIDGDDRYCSAECGESDGDMQAIA